MHSHGVTDYGHQHGWGFDITAGSNSESMYFGGVSVTHGESFYSGTVDVTSSETGISIDDAGGGGSHNILPPVSVINWFIVHG